MRVLKGRKKEMRHLLLTICIWLCIYGFFHVIERRKPSTSQLAAEEYLASMADKDVQMISHIVQKADKEIRLAQVDSLEDELRIRFSDAVFLGDSIIEGIVEYRLLDEQHVVAARGRRTDNSDEDIATAAALAPQQIFLLYGMNDLAYCRGDAQRFREQYQVLLDEVKEKLPSADIYVMAILPIQETAIQENEVYQHYQEFNLALSELCKEEGIHFLDHGDLLTSSKDYEVDGIHPKYAFYPLWLMEIAKEAGL